MLKYGDFAKVVHKPTQKIVSWQDDRTAFYDGQVGRVVGLQQGVYTLLFLPEELKGMADISFFKDLILQAFRETDLEKIQPKVSRPAFTTNSDGSIGEWAAR